MGKEKESYFVCPNCGEEVPTGSRVCPNCGSDDNTGWSENTYLDGIDLPFDEDDYEEVKKREFGDSKGGFRINWMAVVGIAVVVAMLMVFVLQC